MNDFHTKEQIITNYINNVDFKGDWSYKKIKKDLKQMLGEEPAVDITYEKTAVLNEINSEAEEINVIKDISILFSPELDNSVKRLKFDIDIL